MIKCGIYIYHTRNLTAINFRSNTRSGTVLYLDIYKIRKGRITYRIGYVAYHLELPSEFRHVHNVFHVSIKYHHGHSYVVDFEVLEIHEDLRYEEELIKIWKVW